MTRGLNKPETPPIPRDQLPAEVLAELPPGPNDRRSWSPPRRLRKAQAHRQRAGHTYYKLREQWPDAVWVKSRIFDLEQRLAVQNRRRATGPGDRPTRCSSASRNTSVPISRFSSPTPTPTSSQLLQSPRGGGVPPENLICSPMKKPRSRPSALAFQDLLKRRAGKNDTVVILVAGHGTVDGREGYILTYDADPQDLKSTALPMAELNALFDEQLKKVGRVLLFTDVCKAGIIGSIKRASMSDVKQLGGRRGRLCSDFSPAAQESFHRRSAVRRRPRRLQLLRGQGLQGAADPKKTASSTPMS